MTTPATTPTAAPTLEALVSRYRREVARGAGAATFELEVRLPDVTQEHFIAIYTALLAKAEADGRPLALDGGAPTQVVSVLNDARKGRREGARGPQPTWIREIYFEGGVRSRERYVRKEPLTLPVRVAGAAGAGYHVALAAEEVLAGAGGFAADEETVIRVKHRVSFLLTVVGASEQRPELRWRIDMTVLRQLTGSSAKDLKEVVGATFKPATPATFLAALGLGGALTDRLYRFEVEAEFAGPPENCDALRPADVTAAAETLLRLADPGFAREAALQAAVAHVARYASAAPPRGGAGLKQLLPQAVALTRAEYRPLYPPTGLYLTDKADGQRAVAFVRGGQGAVAASELLRFAAPAGAGAAAGDTVVDGELVDGAGGARFYAFDVLAVGGEDVTPDDFGKRQGRLAEAVGLLRAAGVPAEAKAFVRLAGTEPAGLRAEIGGVLSQPRPYATDGLIFVAPGAAYAQTATYKWKPLEHNTIDFLARLAPRSVLGRHPFTARPGHALYFLFVGARADLLEALGLQRCPGYADLFGAAPRAGAPRLSPIQFAPSGAPYAYLYQHPAASPLGPLDGKIVEARCPGDCAAVGAGSGGWEVVRVREDRMRDLRAGRAYGNSLQTAEMTWLNSLDPFPAEQLWEGPPHDYFAQEKTGFHRAQTAVVSFVKSQRIQELGHARWVVDVGAGKGQDLRRYLDAEVRNVVAVDRDRAALAELVRRKYTLARKARGRPRPGATAVHILVADAAAPYQETIARLGALGLPVGTADAFVCNLAVHYFLGTAEGMRNFCALARAALRVGGKAILTVFAGEEVHALFAAERVPEGGTWELREGGALKYALKRLYGGEALEPVGQQIGVLLPFSAGQFYTEYLVNTAALAAEFAARGLRLVARAAVREAIPRFEARNPALAKELTPGDRTYLGLFSELVFLREK